jgi:hypothetical protein
MLLLALIWLGMPSVAESQSPSAVTSSGAEDSDPLVDELREWFRQDFQTLVGEFCGEQLERAERVTGFNERRAVRKSAERLCERCQSEQCPEYAAWVRERARTWVAEIRASQKECLDRPLTSYEVANCRTQLRSRWRNW